MTPYILLNVNQKTEVSLLVAVFDKITETEAAHIVEIRNEIKDKNDTVNASMKMKQLETIFHTNRKHYMICTA